MTPDRSAMPKRRRRAAPRWLGVLLVAALVGVTGAGAWATFIDRGSADAEVGAGVVRLAWPAGGSNRLDVPVAALKPGESAQRTADLVNTGTVPISTVQLTLTGTGTGTASDGIQLALRRCTTAWVASGETYSCPGVVTEVSSSRPVDGRVDLPTSPARAVGGVDRLLFVFALAESSPPTAQNTSGRVTIVADGIQIPGRHQ